MEDSVIQSRKEFFKEKEISLNEEREKNILTLRKKKLNSLILKKRLNNPNINNFSLEININPELLNIPKELEINIISLKETIIKITDYLTSQNLNLIKYVIHLIKEYSINNIFTHEDIELIKQYKILEILNLILQTYYNDIQIINEIIWFFINIQINDSKDRKFLSIIVNEKSLLIYNNFLDCNNDRIVISILWMLSNLVIYEEYKSIILNNQIIEKIINLSKFEITDVELNQYYLQFFSSLVYKFNYDESNIRKKKILQDIIYIGCMNLYNKNDISLGLAYKILSYISEISDIDLLSKIEERGGVMKILKTKYKNDNNFAFFGVKIISNLFCGNDQLIENLLSMNVIYFYDNILKQFPNEKQIILFSLIGLFNLSCNNYQYSKYLMNCIIFNEEIFNFLIESCDDLIHDKICDIMYNLSCSKNIEMLKFLYEKKSILKIISLANSEKKSKDKLIKYLHIIKCYLTSFKEKEKCCLEYQNVRESYINILNNNSNILEFLDNEIINLFLNNLNENSN